MTTQQQLLSAGYVKSPNNIHSLPGDGWYASGPGKVTVKFGEEIRLVSGKLQIWTTKYYQRPDNTFIFPISGIVAEPANLGDMLMYCAQNGRISEPGLPAGYWGWD
jgi:hypothetical protein